MTHVEITPNGSRPTARGPAQTFTGNVTIDPLFDASDHTQCARVARQLRPRRSDSLARHVYTGAV